MIVHRPYDELAEDYEEVKRQAPLAPWTERLLLGWAALLPRPARVLDVGCGHGFEVERMNSELGLRAVGLDLSSGMLRLARQRGRGSCVQGDATRLPVVTGSMDGVWSLHTLLHVADLHAALAEIGRVLRPGGLAALTVALGDGTTVEPVRFRPGAVREFVHHPADDVREAVDDAGLRVLDEGAEAVGRTTKWLLCVRRQAGSQGDQLS